MKRRTLFQLLVAAPLAKLLRLSGPESEVIQLRDECSWRFPPYSPHPTQWSFHGKPVYVDPFAPPDHIFFFDEAIVAHSTDELVAGASEPPQDARSPSPPTHPPDIDPKPPQ